MASHDVPRVTQKRTEEQRLRDVEKIKAYRHLQDQTLSRAASGTYDLELFQLTTKLLHLNPEFYTVWNLRRRCLLSSLLSREADEQQQPGAGDRESDGSVLQSELAFTVPLLMRLPKCYWIWNFRQWVLSQAIARLPVPAARKIWETELGLTSKMLGKDHRNFHAWGYRRLVVASLESPELGGASLAEDEFAFTTAMIGRDLSNFSAWHSRSRLVPRILEERSADDAARAAFLAAELNYVREALNLGPEDQSLWYYHRLLVAQIANPPNQHVIAPRLSDQERATYLRREIEEIRDLLEDYAEVQWIYEALLECILALERLEGGTGRIQDESLGLQALLAKLRAMDPMRAGRWDAIEGHAALQNG
ncbi:hypothetical protein CDD83_6151 [Cordyceps sp. RAO-2017]|nr:hypothetical protein CDD83_6151 [Cordyceps sp. RAO-2017]